MCAEIISKNRPDDLFPCCCYKEGVLCPNNVSVLSSLAAQLHLKIAMFI